VTRRLVPALAVAAVGAAALAAVPAADALPYRQFQSPSHNIRCATDGSFARCDISHASYTPAPKPRSCEFDWGFSFGVTKSARRGRYLCVSDATGNGGRVLAYGSTIRYGSIRCTSRATGMTCLNPRGHGFTVRKAGPKLF
jgi:hypothetical protein